MISEFVAPILLRHSVKVTLYPYHFALQVSTQLSNFNLDNTILLHITDTKTNLKQTHYS